MITIDKNKISKVKKMYSAGLSVREVAEKLGVSIDAAYYFFRKNGIARRTFSQSNGVRFDRKELSFKLKKKLSRKAQLLQLSGIMLYWGEGSKWAGGKTVDFANSNPAMIKVFLEFLRQVCRIDEKKLRVYLYHFSNQSTKKLIDFWSKETRISKTQFTKPYVKKDYDLGRKSKMEHGLIHIRYCDKKLLNYILEEIESYKRKFA